MKKLDPGQIDNMRLAYKAAARSGDQVVIDGRIAQLARDFGIPENTVREYVGAEAEPADNSVPTKTARHEGGQLPVELL